MSQYDDYLKKKREKIDASRKLREQFDKFYATPEVGLPKFVEKLGINANSMDQALLEGLNKFYQWLPEQYKLFPEKGIDLAMFRADLNFVKDFLTNDRFWKPLPHQTKAIESSKSVVDRTETIIKCWDLFNINDLDFENERIFIITDKAHYKVKFNFKTGTVIHHKRFPHTDVIKIKWGTFKQGKSNVSSLLRKLAYKNQHGFQIWLRSREKYKRSSDDQEDGIGKKKNPFTTYRALENDSSVVMEICLALATAVYRDKAKKDIPYFPGFFPIDIKIPLICIKSKKLVRDPNNGLVSFVKNLASKPYKGDKEAAEQRNNSLSDLNSAASKAVDNQVTFTITFDPDVIQSANIVNGVQSQITDIQQSWLETCNHSVGRDALKKVTTVQIRIHNTGDVPCKFTNQQDINTLVVDYHSGYLSNRQLFTSSTLQASLGVNGDILKHKASESFKSINSKIPLECMHIKTLKSNALGDWNFFTAASFTNMTPNDQLTVVQNAAQLMGIIVSSTHKATPAFFAAVTKIKVVIDGNNRQPPEGSISVNNKELLVTYNISEAMTIQNSQFWKERVFDVAGVLVVEADAETSEYRNATSQKLGETLSGIVPILVDWQWTNSPQFQKLPSVERYQLVCCYNTDLMSKTLYNENALMAGVGICEFMEVVKAISSKVQSIQVSVEPKDNVNQRVLLNANTLIVKVNLKDLVAKNFWGISWDLQQLLGIQGLVVEESIKSANMLIENTTAMVSQSISQRVKIDVAWDTLTRIPELQMNLQHHIKRVSHIPDKLFFSPSTAPWGCVGIATEATRNPAFANAVKNVSVFRIVLNPANNVYHKIGISKTLIPPYYGVSFAQGVFTITINANLEPQSVVGIARHVQFLLITPQFVDEEGREITNYAKKLESDEIAKREAEIEAVKKHNEKEKKKYADEAEWNQKQYVKQQTEKCKSCYGKMTTMCSCPGNGNSCTTCYGSKKKPCVSCKSTGLMYPKGPPKPAVPPSPQLKQAPVFGPLPDFRELV